MRRAAIALAGLLVVILAWNTSRAPQTAELPKTPTRQAIERDAKIESESDSASESQPEPESVANNPQNGVSAQDASLAPMQEEQNTEESSAATADYSESPIVITKELPSYLKFYAQRDPNSKMCLTPFDLLDEMQTLERNEASDARTEKNLKDLLEPHPLGFPVTVTCGGGICQISDLGPSERIREQTSKYDTYWSEFGQRLRQVDPIASELATYSVAYAPYPEDTSQSIVAFILTTKDRVITADSLDCPSFDLPKRN